MIDSGIADRGLRRDSPGMRTADRNSTICWMRLSRASSSLLHWFSRAHLLKVRTLPLSGRYRAISDAICILWSHTVGSGPIIAEPVHGGLHHVYRTVA